ncbi:DNA-methyltransferase [Neptuniibacter halophilus]|uniref:DNA-methyltransferase n=1 Tax=Neptuniibacter halophilus TaxID=651666 RepID=UPI00257440D0|nr:DNA methyltransferase [Neptuniibacter halophilus]
MIELLNVDCMEYMRSLEDNAFDLAIVDPPYGLGEAGKRSGTRSSKSGAQKFWGTKNTRGTAIKSTPFADKDWDNEPPSAEYFEELKRVSRNQIIWGANHFADRFNSASSSWLVWDKDNGTSNFADCELAYTSFPTAVRMFKYRWSGMLQGDMRNKEKRIHPTQKPVKLYQWLLSKYAKPGDRILDTHLGSGSSAIAAHIEGLDFVGTELDSDYFKVTKERVEKETMQAELMLAYGNSTA